MDVSPTGCVVNLKISRNDQLGEKIIGFPTTGCPTYRVKNCFIIFFAITLGPFNLMSNEVVRLRLLNTDGDYVKSKLTQLVPFTFADSGAIAILFTSIHTVFQMYKYGKALSVDMSYSHSKHKHNINTISTTIIIICAVRVVYTPGHQSCT
jgi:hypothetical protein